MDHAIWRRWWATVSGIPTIQPSAQSIERDNRDRKESRMPKLRNSHTRLALSCWNDMLSADMQKIAPISRRPDIRGGPLGHPPGNSAKTRAAAYCREVKVAFATSDEEGNKECTMLCGSADLHAGPWFMRHFSDTAAKTTWAEMAGLACRYLRPQSGPSNTKADALGKRKGGPGSGGPRGGGEVPSAPIPESKRQVSPWDYSKNVCNICNIFNTTGHQNIPYITGHQNMVCVAGEASMGKGGCG